MQKNNALQTNLKFQSISEESIYLLVHTFYGDVRKNAILGPVFDNVLRDQWATHMPRMVDFWSSILLGTGKFQGNVYGKHMALTDIKKEHFVQWLSLFQKTVSSLFNEESANKILETADRIAGSLQYGYFGEKKVQLANLTINN